MAGTNLREPDAGIARTTFYYEGVGVNLTRLQHSFYDGDTGTALGTAARIQTFQFREAVEV